MRCEYCDLDLLDVADARRHMLTIAHARKINEYELIAIKHIQQLRLKDYRPRDFSKLLELLNLRSTDDIDAIDKLKFFKIETKTQGKIASELCHILCQSSHEYHLNGLPQSLRETLTLAARNDFKLPQDFSFPPSLSK